MQTDMKEPVSGGYALSIAVAWRKALRDRYHSNICMNDSQDERILMAASCFYRACLLCSDTFSFFID